MEASLTSCVLANPDKVAKVTRATASLDRQGWTWFGLTCEGGGRRNTMSICNSTKNSIELERMYIHWGKIKIPPEAYIPSMQQDDCLFHNAGSWSAAGSSGIVTYRLQHETNLHILWDCPLNFDFSNNFIGLMLTSTPDRRIPNQQLFKNMYQDWDGMGLTPKVESTYDLVCCGPGKGDSIEADGRKPWGHLRPCKVQDEHYKVLAIMGDRHATYSKITILDVTECSC